MANIVNCLDNDGRWCKGNFITATDGDSHEINPNIV